MKKELLIVVLMMAVCVSVFAQDTGGPDNFGYTFANSNAANGPVYSWIEPSTTNQITTLTDDNTVGPFPIGFEFPYYDGIYEEYWLCSNGWLSFTQTTNADRTPEAIPNATLPNNQVSWLWMDLDPADNPDTLTFIYYENLTDDNSHLLTFLQYHEYPGAGEEYVTMQVRLFTNGDILFQYDTFTDSFPTEPDNRPATGIENADGTDGLQYAFQQPEQYSNQLAVLFSYPAGVDNDLSAQGIETDGVATVNEQETFTVTVRNRGAVAQDTYSVKLWRDGDILLDEVSGTTINPDESLTFDLHWTPSTDGVAQVWGEVVLDGDENPDNNDTGMEQVTVLPEGCSVSVIGDGVDYDYQVPLNYFYKNSLSQQLYFADELNNEGDIYAISWAYTFLSTVPGKPIKIWMEHTTQTDLTSGWTPAGDMTLVYDGSPAIEAGEGDLLLTLDTPFAYDGVSNLLVFTQRVMDTEFYTTSDEFYYTTTPDHPSRSIEEEDDTVVFDPMVPPDTFQEHDYVPNTIMYFVASSATGIGGTVYDSNTMVLPGATVTIGNETTTTLTDGTYYMELAPGTYDITVSKAGHLDETATGVVVTENNVTEQDFTLEICYTVTVTAECNDGGAITGAQLSFTGDGFTFTETFGAAGEIIIPNVPNADYNLVITHDGYDTYEEAVTPNDNIEIEVTLLETLTVPGDLACDTEGLFTWSAPAAPLQLRKTNARREQALPRSLTGYEVYLDGTLVTTITDTEYQFTDLIVDQEYTAGVKAVYTTGTSDLETTQFTYVPVSVNPDIPAVNAWAGNYPNPFNPTTTLRFSLAEQQEVRIDIYNMRGQKVRTLINETRPAGDNLVTWNGADDNGNQQASGVYMGRLQATGFSKTFKMIMMK